MEERESSVVSTDFYESEANATSPTAVRNDAPLAKRKADEKPSEPEKKRKLVASSPPTPHPLRSCARLPPALWQHIFSFCSLADLGRLIQVNRHFFSYLINVSSASTSKSDAGRLRLVKSESLWASARNALPTKPPKPLPGFSELHMWQLAWNKRCQFCNRVNSHTPGERIWQHGPGDSGVRVIWPFAVRSCGPCLLQQCQTDASLLFSAASALRPALPFALLTSDQHYVAAYSLQSATTPANVEIAKYYYKKHVDDITRALEEALNFGPAAAEEWSKGLDARGKERMRVADNWERWEVKHQWMEEHSEKREPSVAPSLAATSQKEPSKSPACRTPSPVIHAPTPATPASHAQARPPTVPPQTFTPSGQRNLHDANEAKATRKTDIERRCLQMRSPIAPNILRHMDSFKAAIQISQPMTEHAWSVLEPRMLAQLPPPQQAEADHLSRTAALPTRTADRRHPDANSKEAREVMDREWEESQRPIRDRLDAIADDFINQEWEHGNAVTYESSPKFAVDLLTYVRRASYAERARQEAARGDNANNADRPILVLDNMKWVYDNKIRPLTEQFRKEIFLCYGNGCEHNNKFYGFEGVIQHYGAKHTAAFSSGNVVVAWREAEWPEETPFHPDPTSVKHVHHAHHASSGSTTGYGGFFSTYSRAGTSTPQMPSHLPQASPGPYNYGGQYGPFAPPQVAPSALPGFEYPQSYATPVDMYAHQVMGPPGYGPPGHAYLTSPAMVNTGVAPPPIMPAPIHGNPETAPNGTEEVGHSTSSFDKQVSTVIDMTQDLWRCTSGIKDMPNSLRIYVLLHRVISKFHVEFNHEPNLNHFVDALSNHEMPKALKNAPGLSCKACQVESHQVSAAYYSKSDERKTYTVLSLLFHFRAQHLTFQQPNPGHGPPATLDWKEDMIELPSERFISGLIHAPGMDDEKLLMIATVFPRSFPTPLPKIGVINNHGLASPASSGPKEAKESSNSADAPGEALGSNGSASSIPVQSEPSDTHRPTLATSSNEAGTSTNRKRSYRDSPPAERRHHYAEPRYYVGSLQHSDEYHRSANIAVRQMAREHLEDGYSRPREYVEYAPSPRMIHAGPAYEEYTGRRTAFREQERFYGPPPEEVVYTHPREGSHGSREYSAYPRQVRYYEEDDHRPEYRYLNERRSRDASPPRGQSAADRFLDELALGQGSSDETPRPQPPEPKSAAPAQELEDGTRFTPPPPDAPKAAEAGTQVRPLAPPHPRAPSTVSNGSRYDDYGSSNRHMPMQDVGPPRRPGPHRRRDRHEPRMPSRYQRYMGVARDDAYGRGSSMSRSKSRRYEEQRRRIDQQETPQPNAEPEYDPSYSRETSVEQPVPEDGYYQQVRRPPRGYVSVQDRLHPHPHAYSPPRYRYDEPRGHQPVYVDEYGYEVIRVPRQPRGPYVSHQPPRYEQDYQYMPMAYERPSPQRYNSRPDDYMYYGERERERPLPRRPAPDAESDVYEPPPPEIKIENVPVPMPEAS